MNLFLLGLSQSSRASSNTSLNKMPSNGEDSSTSSTVSCGSNVSLPSQENYSNNGIKSVVNPQIQVQTVLPPNSLFRRFTVSEFS